MINIIKIITLFTTIGLLNNCSQVLETVDLEIDTQDNIKQETFNVTQRTLTISEARKQSNSPYIRRVLQTGSGQDAKPILESIATASTFPKFTNPTDYKLGIGDSLLFYRLVDNAAKSKNDVIQWPPEVENFDYKLGIGDELSLVQVVEETIPAIRDTSSGTISPPQTTKKVLQSIGRIGSDGSILLLEVGKLDAANKTLKQLRSEVRNVLIRNGASPRFQLEISQFRSQRAYLTINENSSFVTLDDQKTDLRETLSIAGTGLKPGIVTRITLQRDTEKFIMNLRDVFDANAPLVTVKNRDHIFVEDLKSSTNTSETTVGHDGTIILEGVGKIKAKNKTLNEVQNEIALLMKKLPDSENTFQIEINKFKSKTVLLNIPGKVGGTIELTNKPLTLLELLTRQGLSKDGSKVTRITLKRLDEIYSFTFDKLLKNNLNPINLQHNDHIVVEFLEYKTDKVFILGGVRPQIVEIKPAQRQTLADILFTPGGVLATDAAKRSQVYLLRGKDSVVAYHLDAQSPTRLIVAEAMELRPNDILYVAEQPIMSFNRTLTTILPLRLLLRDIQDDNIP